MRFAEFHLVRYGQFEDCKIVLPANTRYLQLIYGPNEAGKSTTMAAVSDLLFGFPHTTPFDFRFDRQLLRVGAIISSESGIFRCRRKKGNKGTLVDDDDHPIDEGPLAALLGGQVSESFQRMFSLDHSRLREGGQAILDAKDDAGQAIFAAGSGLIGVVQLAAQLEKEALDIWADRAAAHRKYYAASRDYDEARAHLRENQLKSAQWAERKKVFETAEADLKRRRDDRAKLQRQLVAVERARRILSPIAARQHLLDELATLGDQPSLPIDARAILTAALRAISEAETEERLASVQKEDADRDKSQLSYNESILRHRQVIASLRSTKGAVDKAILDTPSLRSKAQAGTTDIKRLLTEIGWEEMSAVELQGRLPGRPQLGMLRQLIEEKTGLDAAATAALREVELQREAGEEVSREIAALSPAIDQNPLEAALRLVRSKGDLAAVGRTAAQKKERSASALNNALETLRPWNGNAADLAKLVLPGEADVTRLMGAISQASQELADERKSVREKMEEKARKGLEREHMLNDEHAVPATALVSARQVRDANWSEIDAYIRGHMALADPVASADRFHAGILEADKISDRRFEAAEISAALASIERDIARLSLAIAQGEARVAAAANSHDMALRDWSRVVGNIDPAMTPTDFIAWRGRRDRALELAAGLIADEGEIAATEATAVEAKAALLTLPINVDDANRETLPLSLLLSAAEQLEAEAKDQNQKRTDLKARQATISLAAIRANSRLAQAEGDMGNWKDRWVASLRGVGLDGEAPVAIIRVQIELLDQLGVLVRDTIGYERRIADIGADIEAFAKAVRQISGECGLDNLEREPSDLLSVLEVEIETAAKLAERSNGLAAQISKADDQQRIARQRIEAAKATLRPLLIATGVESADQLDAVIERVDDCRTKRLRTEQIAQEILNAGDGLSLEQLIGEAEGKDLATLVTANESIKGQLEELASEIEQLAEHRRAAELAFHEGDEKTDAAVAVADQALARAEMEVQAEAYVRKRAEKELLQWTINRYREEKQAPLLKRATEIFSTLTLGKYAALSVEVDGDKPLLSAVETGRASIVPAFRLSEGARDQLYLALRLAAVEEAVAAGLKLPFLADDLFINYDNERAAAGFRVLAELAQKTQVLFFTHHEHLLELAKLAVSPISISSCQLDTSAKAA